VNVLGAAVHTLWDRANEQGLNLRAVFVCVFPDSREGGFDHFVAIELIVVESRRFNLELNSICGVGS